MQGNQEFFRNPSKFEDLDEEERNRDDSEEFLTDDHATSIEALRARIEDIDNIQADTLASLEEALDTAELWQGRSLQKKNWQQVINRLGKVVEDLEVGKSSGVYTDLRDIEETISDLQAKS